MMRALYSGVAGLRNHQTRMDVIGNNIANVNTAGFKASRVIFQDLYSQTLSSASAPVGTTQGGTNPKQVGLGVSIASIDVLHTNSATQYTGAELDFAIEGDGFFSLSNGTDLYYTRAGALALDSSYNLVNPNGLFVQGFELDAAGNIVLDGSGNPVLQNIVISPNYYGITVDKNGVIVGIDKITGDRDTLGQIALATFPNESGLQKAGQNTYIVSGNSGNPTFVAPSSAGSGSLVSGSLEMSNVDLTNEFSDMIVTQRGFQANSRIITTTDQMLEEIVNLKR